MEHDYINFPELTNAQLAQFGLTSPFPQITENFYAIVEKVHDGDTITLRTDFRDFGFPLRFLDIDSPEMNNGGDIARDWLRGRIQGEAVFVIIDPNNRVGKYGRLLGRVMHRGLDMGETELRLGLAVPFGKKNEGMLPSMAKELDRGKWLST